jgi:hypothetical protein
MVKKGSKDKPIKFTELELSDFERFGCTFRERSGILFIDWAGKSLGLASHAEIFAAVGSIESKAGPLVVVALEISPIRPLPLYCYFPFDVTRDVHRKFLSALTQTGKINLCFIAGRKTIERKHQLGPFLRNRAAERYAASLQALEEFGRSEYQFERALLLMERWVRIPQFLEHLLSQQDVDEIRADIGEAVRRVPAERRDLAHRIVKKAVGTFNSEYERNKNTLLQTGQIARLGFLFIADSDRLSTENPSLGATELVADGMAATFSQGDIENVDAWLKVFVSLSALIDLFRSDSVPSPTSMLSPFLPMLPKGVGDALELIEAKKGVSQGSLKKFAELLGVPVQGKPGRPPKDYSREYELRTSAKSWPDVARVALSERPELRAEFNETDYDHLAPVQQELLWNRIRQGVTAHAKKIGKPLAIDGDEPDMTKG